VSTQVQEPAVAPALPKPPKGRVKTPTILQMEAVECGAAALAIVLAYFGRWVPLEELRHECGVSRDGSKASNVLKAARKYGLDAKGYKYEDAREAVRPEVPRHPLLELQPLPRARGLRRREGVPERPGRGPRVITMQELDASYSGVVLTFEPGPEFKKGGEAPNMSPALRRRLVGSESALLYTILCGLLLVIPGLVIPTFTRVFIDDYLLAGQAWLITPLMLAMAATVVIQGALTWLQRYYLLRLETRLALGTSSRFFNHILRLPAAYFGQRFAGEIGSRVQINDKVAKVISGKLATTVIDSVMTVFYALLMFTYSVSLTFVVIGIAMLNVAAVKLAARIRTDASRRLMQDKGKLMGTAMNGLRMIETLKATGSEGEFFGRWAGYYAKSINTEQQLNVLSQISGAVPPFVQTMSTAAVLVLGGIKVMEGELTVGMLVAYQTLLGSFTRPLTSFVQFGSTLQELQADMNRLDDVIRYPEDKQYSAGAGQAFEPKRVKLSGKVELRNITFGYSPLDKPLVEDFNLVVQPGRRVALVGSSGSGKSTVAKLVSGLYEPWSGEVLFDDVPRGAGTRPRGQLPRRGRPGGVPVRRLGLRERHDVGPDDRAAAHHRGVPRRRDRRGDRSPRERGYQSRVQEGGGNFSGGQCQRLEIARALVGDPSIIILDEATSALDPTTEVWIDESIRRRGCTCIIIAHRLSTIRDADEIVVLDRGKIVQRGTHEEMKDKDGPYRRLIGLH
jgi:NHLM bacteriocin system ABC transporter peptidase/ATP-binding protein